MMTYKKRIDEIAVANEGLKTLFTSSLIGQNATPRVKGPISNEIKLKKGGMMAFLKLRF